MKKIILLILCLILLPLGTFACGGADTGIKMTAEVLSVGEELSVEVIFSEYTFGVHTVLLSPDTEYLEKCGRKISLEDIKVGDRVEIFYNGQVMMSYPPKIVARKIILE